MSQYHPRRAPNVSQYLANLNTIPSAHEVPSDLHLGEGDLDFLTNAEFFDFDSFQPSHGDLHHSPHEAEKVHRVATHGQQYQFGEFQTYSATVGSTPVLGSLHGQYPPQPSHHLSYGSPQVGDKRKPSVTNTIPSPGDLEDSSRVAAEEDKRRRNTAASARFRVKKKQREQALEKQTKEMTDKVQALEGKVQQLEMENKWLKGLITDKNDGKTLESITNDREADDRKTDKHTTGVGTIDVDVDVDEDDEGDEDAEDVKDEE